MTTQRKSQHKALPKALVTSLGLVAAGAPGIGLAQTVGGCGGWQTQAENIVEPWEAFSRTFANGAVRIALLDTIEPGAVPYHLLVLSPPYDELGARQCRVVSVAEGFGFADVSFGALQARYDPDRGLVIEMPVAIGAGDGPEPAALTLAVNQTTGDVTAVLDRAGK